MMIIGRDALPQAAVKQQ